MSNFTQTELEQALLQCESEPIHQIGQIQPHGVMLVLSPDSQRIIIQASSNFHVLFDVPFADVCGKRLTELIADSEVEKIERLIKNANDKNSPSGMLSVKFLQKVLNLQVRVFVSGGAYVLELINDESSKQGNQWDSLMSPLQNAMQTLKIETDVYRELNLVASVVGELTGFDRVMIYRFDSNWEGEVIAECKRDSVHSYLGTRFPASDIPPQARRLYTTNPVRQIADTNAKPVPVLPGLNPVTGQPLDLSNSLLRSLSPVHIEYLHNMGVQASLSISLLQNGRLWGLIACHHMTPKFLTNSFLETAAIISQLISAKLALIDIQEQQNMGLEASRIIGELLKKITADSVSSIMRLLLPELMALLNSTGIIGVVEGKQYVNGDVPEPAQVFELLSWLGTQSSTESFSSDYLSRDFSAAAAYPEIASGVLVAPLTPDMRNSIIWLRKEKLRTVNWAGKPEKIFLNDPAGIRLSPRKSFESWTELWRGRCTAWSQAECKTAQSAALAITQGLAQKKLLEQAQADRIRADQQLKQANQIMEIFENSPIAVHIADLSTTHIVFSNQRYAELVGSKSFKVIGSNLKDYFGNQEDYDEVIDKVRQGEQISDRLIELRKPADHLNTKWTLTSFLQIEFQNTPSVLGWYYDISDRKHAEDELRVAAATFESQDAVMITDANANIIKVNRAFTTVTGFTPDDVLGKNPRIMKSGLHSNQFYIDMFAKISKDGSWEGEIWDKKKDGNIYPRWVTITALKDERDNISQYVAIFNDITERKKNDELIRNLAFYDALTQLPNRRMLLDRLKQAMLNNKRSRVYGALMFLDLDNFKPLNDNHGHSMGDLLLIEVASRLRDSMREADTVARFGGDEFVVILNELDQDKAKSTQQAHIVADKIRKVLSEPYQLTIKNEGKADTVVEHHSSTSIGVVLFNELEGSVDEVLQWADLAMYRAKDSGRNSIRFYA